VHRDVACSHQPCQGVPGLSRHRQAGKLAAGAAGIGLFFAFWSWVGFDHVVFHAPGDDQARFLELYGSQILPRIRSRWG
jgi:hypothetical protein